ncbi:MAG: iron-containing alcohol dehydrogenase [Lachnospiraceae bacterium]|uniref:iron-containing alcohol dehydrogenase n=1 Tax=Galactobacillus timonensis TaxID=2041840 RepID=UPI0023EFB078|nr:iron-containing alcohol dehydrogenase [Galactobacillus timonensis]MDD7087375.1 iron-containing alcohol dehydrogenase [Galactobacillus timonensis]MDY5222826.1 iron-containing alcohol dehydrogenase [Lachnospiraceae bacterium]
MAREFLVPGHIITGAGALDAAEKIFPTMGKKALVVTDPVMIKLGNCAKVEAALKQKHVPYAVYSDIVGEPNNIMIENGLRKYREEGCDFLIAIGGGSCLDSMKAIGALAVNGGDIADFFGKTIDVEMPPMAAIPTTAGTGSEATQFTIITDTRKDVKMLLKGPKLIPSLAVIDPQFTMTAPPAVTANTGLDALCHCVEAYTSRKAQTLSDTFAVSAVKRIFANLPTAYHDGSNQEARIQMSVAALEAGIAFNNSSVTLIHGMSRPIGALFHVAHGLSNAMLMNVCLTFALPGAYDRFGDLGRAIGVADASDTDQAAAEKFLDALKKLVAEMEIPTPEAYGIDRETFMNVIPKMAHDAMESGSPQNTIRDITVEQVSDLYRQLW